MDTRKSEAHAEFMKYWAVREANLIFLAHCLIGVFILSGWYFREVKIAYLALLTGWLACWVFLGYCPLTKWEFTLRRKYDKSFDPYDEAIQHYVYKFFGKKIPARTIFTGGIVVLIILVILTLIV